MKRKVIFWGCGKVAREMYGKFKDCITLLRGISNDPKETCFVPEEGFEVPVKRPEKKDKRPDGVIVICSGDYESIAEQLSLLGYVPFVDFMDYELAEILWAGKGIALLYGFCHLRGVARCLEKAEGFARSYVPVYCPNYLPLNFYQQERLGFLADHCSVFVYGVALSQKNHRKNSAILERLGPHVKVMRLHAAYFGAYFPQKQRAYNDLNALAVKCEGYDYTPFSYGDSWLNERIAEGMGPEEVLELAESGEIYGRDFILRYAQGEWKRLKYQEGESDFKILGYIEKHYRERRLFRNETHMENDILRQYALQILGRLGCSEEMDAIHAPLLNCSQHVIYPCVAEMLGLGWDPWQEELDLYTYGGWVKVSAREYVLRYYEACGGMLRLKKKFLLP